MAGGHLLLARPEPATTVPRRGKPSAAQDHLTAAREAARRTEAAYAVVTAGNIPANVRDQAAHLVALAGHEFGRACEKLDDLDGADAGFGRAVAGLQALVKASGQNLKSRTNLSVAAAEYGDWC